MPKDEWPWPLPHNSNQRSRLINTRLRITQSDLESIDNLSKATQLVGEKQTHEPFVFFHVYRYRLPRLRLLGHFQCRIWGWFCQCNALHRRCLWSLHCLDVLKQVPKLASEVDHRLATYQVHRRKAVCQFWSLKIVVNDNSATALLFDVMRMCWWATCDGHSLYWTSSKK